MRSTCSDLRITPVSFQLDQEAVDEYRSMDWDQMSDINDGLKTSRSDGMVAIVRLPANRSPEHLMVCSFVDTNLFVAELMRCNPYNCGPEVIGWKSLAGLRSWNHQRGRFTDRKNMERRTPRRGQFGFASSLTNSC